MPKASIGKLVRYHEYDHEFVALITHSEDTPDSIAYLTVFGLQGESYKKAPYSETPKQGTWTLPPSTAKMK